MVRARSTPKWSAGMYSLISQFQQLLPNTLISVHANQAPPDSRALAAENGDAFVFDATNIREGTMAFGTLYDSYQQWFVQGGRRRLSPRYRLRPRIRSPTVTDIRRYAAALPSTVTFGQTWYPNMRFGLGLTLMNNGYSIFDFGDTTSPVTWWYDEYNFNLGTPVTPATLIGPGPGPNETVNGGLLTSI